MNQVPYIFNENSVTIFWDGKPYTILKDHSNYLSVESALLEARYDDLEKHLDIATAIEDFVKGDIEVRDEVVSYKGYRLHGVVVDKLLKMLRAGMKDSAPLVNFITRLQSNPSANSVNELYSFMSYKSLPNTPEGKILGYKGVGEDFYSNTGNADTIVVQGEINDRHQILNEVGATIEVARRSVDDNKDHHCSYGLHIGSYDYANGWAGENGRLLVVEFDPEDAVSVPTDCDFQKLRVCKYKVISDITDTRKEISKPVYDANKPIYNDSEDDYDYDDDDLDDDLDDDDDDFLDEYDMANDDSIIPEALDNMEENSSAHKIYKYILDKHSQGVYPTLKNVVDLRSSREDRLCVAQAELLVRSMGFKLDTSGQPLYLSIVEPNE